MGLEAFFCITDGRQHAKYRHGMVQLAGFLWPGEGLHLRFLQDAAFCRWQRWPLDGGSSRNVVRRRTWRCSSTLLIDVCTRLELVLPGGFYLCRAFQHTLHAGADDGLDFPGGLCAAPGQRTHLAGHHRKAAPCSPARAASTAASSAKDVGLKGNTVNDTDDVGDALKRKPGCRAWSAPPAPPPVHPAAPPCSPLRQFPRPHWLSPPRVTLRWTTVQSPPRSFSATWPPARCARTNCGWPLKFRSVQAHHLHSITHLQYQRIEPLLHSTKSLRTSAISQRPADASAGVRSPCPRRGPLPAIHEWAARWNARWPAPALPTATRPPP